MTDNSVNKKPLDAATLMAQAEEVTGLSDWGQDHSFEVGLGKLVDAVEAMACGPLLRDAVTEQSVQLLSTRLRLNDDANKHPEILSSKIERPLIVAGLPRTGTTWLFELLELDPMVRAPLDWEVVAPWPAPEAATFEADPRIAQVQSGYEEMLKLVPEFATMHQVGAQLPQECNAIAQYHFASSNFWASYGVPDYLDWITFGHPTGVMKTHRRFLQQLQWKGPRGRWTLKSPPYLLMLDDLLEAYPDACLVQTHREPAKMVASLSNMVRTIRKVRFGHIEELLDPKAIARSVLLHFGEALERSTRDRQNPSIDKRFIDIAYRDTVADPVGTVKRIYTHFNIPWTADYEQRLKEHIGVDRSTGHGKHIYDPAEFGIDELDLPNQFSEYRARFGDLLSDN